MKTKKKAGRPREYDYTGNKIVTSIRLTEEEKTEILSRYKSIQAFIQDMLNKFISNKQ